MLGLLFNRVYRWLAMIGALLAALAAAILFGWTKRGQVESVKALEGYKQTRKEMDDANSEVRNDPDVAREWLRSRQRDKR